MNTIIDKIDLWTTAQELKTSNRGLSASNQSLLGIKKLRELILELAVRGKLVSQDPNDEPASELLKKIEAEKRKLIKEGKVKKQEGLLEVGDDEKPFELPEGWVWVHLIKLYYSISPSGKKLKSSEIIEKGAYPVVDQGKSFIAGYSNDTELLIKIPGPVIIFGDHTKEIKYIDFNFIAGADGTKILRPYKMFERFFYTYLLSYKLENRGYARHFKILNDNLFALPPLAEQQRIVAKVDELMALCDELENQQTNSNVAHEILVATLLGSLTDAENSNSFDESWQRIANHFDILFTTEHSIDQLKQTILQLAVMGKLVPQYPEDEPASELLKKIAKEKTRLVKEGKIKKQASLPEITEDEKPFDLPKGWEWVKFGELNQFINGDRSKNYPNQNEYVDEGVAWINTGHIEPNGRLTTFDMNYITREKFESLRSGKIQKGDIVYCLRGATFGKTAFVEPYEEGAIASSLMIIRSYNLEFRNYIFYYLISPMAKKQLSRFDNGSAQPNLSANSVTLYSFPLPPLTEQYRIVSKVDELFALCDNLKERLVEAQTLQNQLAVAVVEQALN